MRSTLEQRRSAWKRRASSVCLLVIVAISFSDGAARQFPWSQRKRSSQIVGSSLPRTRTALTQAEVPASCPPGKVAIAPADVGVGDAVRCLPVEGTRCKAAASIRSTVASRLSSSSASRDEPSGFAGTLCASFAGARRTGRRLVGLLPGRRQDRRPQVLARLGDEGNEAVINLSYPRLPAARPASPTANGQLALPATGSAVGTLAHETMHIAGIDDEGSPTATRCSSPP